MVQTLDADAQIEGVSDLREDLLDIPCGERAECEVAQQLVGKLHRCIQCGAPKRDELLVAAEVPAHGVQDCGGALTTADRTYDLGDTDIGCFGQRDLCGVTEQHFDPVAKSELLHPRDGLPIALWHQLDGVRFSSACLDAQPRQQYLRPRSNFHDNLARHALRERPAIAVVTPLVTGHRMIREVVVDEVLGDRRPPLVLGRVLRHDACGQAVAVYDDCCADQPSVTTQCALDLAELDAKAPQLDLVVPPSDKVQFAVWQEARQVSGSVHTACSKPVLHEARGRQVVPVPVAPRHARTSDI